MSNKHNYAAATSGRCVSKLQGSKITVTVHCMQVMSQPIPLFAEEWVGLAYNIGA